MQLGQVIRVVTVSTTDLTAAAITNAIITADIQNVQVGAGGTCRGRIKSLALASVQNLAWEIDFFGTADYATTGALDTTFFLGRYAFAVGDGLQIAATGFYYYYVDGLDIVYQDFDITNKARNPVAAVGKIHLGVVNRSATSKIAGASGALTVAIGFEPTLTGQ